VKYQEQITSGPAQIGIEVHTSELMEWVLDDTTFLDYRLGKVERTHAITTNKIDLLWDRDAVQKTVNFRDDQLILTGNWAQGELQRILVTLIARRMEERDVYLFHSSAVRYRDTTILFMGGESNNGKTMAQIEARRRGGAFIATETTVIDRKTEQVIAGSRDVFLVKRAKGTERADKPSQNIGIQKLFGGVLPDLDVFYTQPTRIDRVILPDIDGHFDVSVTALGEYEKAYQSFHCLVNYMGLNILLAPGLPMPVLDTAELRAKRAEFIQEFIGGNGSRPKPYHVIRTRTPQLMLDEVEKLLESV
jgi:hypothetical protein